MATRLKLLQLSTTLLPFFLALPAQAFDPSEGANDFGYQPAARPANQPYAWRANEMHLPKSVVPTRYRSAPATTAMPAAMPTPQPPVIAPAPVAQSIVYAPDPSMPVRAVAVAPAPASVPAPLPAPSAAYVPPPPAFDPAAPRYTPAENLAPMPADMPAPVPYAPAPMGYNAPAENYVAPTYTPYIAPQEAPQFRKNRFTVEGEAFYDNYQEPDTFPDLENKAYYGSLAGSWQYYFTPAWYSNLEGRVSLGSEDYHSNSGDADNIRQWEYETRWMAGYDMNYGGGHHLKTYLGLGSRYYRDLSKGVVTSLGANGYERRIFQLYVPFGVTYEFPAGGGWTLAPNLEVDTLLYGHVNSRLENISGGGFSNASNNQYSGLGLRGEFMFRKPVSQNQAWEIGPFFRYWNIDDSDPDFSAGALEPQNERWQVGAKAKYLF